MAIWPLFFLSSKRLFEKQQLSIRGQFSYPSDKFLLLTTGIELFVLLHSNLPSEFLSFLSPFSSLNPQIYLGEAGCCAGDPGVAFSHFKFHQISAVAFARPGERHLQHIPQKGKKVVKRDTHTHTPLSPKVICFFHNLGLNFVELVIIPRYDFTFYSPS